MRQFMYKALYLTWHSARSQDTPCFTLDNVTNITVILWLILTNILNYEQDEGSR